VSVQDHGRFQGQIDDYITRLRQALDSVDRGEVETLVRVVLDAYERDATVFVCGNGGSASTASHMACDLNKGVGFGRARRLRVHPLTDNVATLTAYANDVGYEDVFVEQLRTFLRPGDVVLGISGSGNSPNVLRAIELANERGNATVGLTGFDGGALKRIARHGVHVAVRDMQIAEDVHMALNHLLMQVLCRAMDGSDAAAATSRTAGAAH
jgi:D-sedoheptulose 7-phosphate isomerase